MQTLKQITALLLMALLIAPAAPAQDAPRTIAANQAVTQDVTIIIQQQQVRFAAQRVVEQLYLQVTNQAGEVVFDSGAAGVQEIFWPLQQADGAALKSGLYAYTLTIKEQGGSEARTRRGHFIVDRAQDRDGADKLWVTSANTSGVGTELTVARDENAVVAGATTSGERTTGQRGESLSRGNSERGVEAGAEKQTLEAKTTTVAAASGTTGYIAKFTSASDLGNSVMAEQNGKIGIGTANPISKLHVLSGANDLPARLQSSGASSFAAGWDFYQGTVGKGYVGVPDPSAVFAPSEMLVFGGASTKTTLWAGGARAVTLDTNGNVGIGISNPTTKFHIVSGAGDYYPPRLQSSGNNSFAAGWDFYHGATPKGYVGVPNPAATQAPGEMLIFGSVGTKTALFAGGYRSVTLDTNGNVGIGTATPEPAAKLHVAGSFLRVDGARNEQAYIGGDGVGNLDVNVGSSNPSVTDVVLWNRATSRHMKLVASVLTITGGADFAEHFDVNEAPSIEAETQKVEPGLVVSIDPTSPGKLALSTQAYDRRVAGIISGAGGVKPGMMMSQAGTLADGQHPVALSGRVYCWADASNGAIKPGDLLTTAATPGHAMKVTDKEKAQGAIIGKAMTGLTAGKGLVLVLVTLQ